MSANCVVAAGRFQGDICACICALALPRPERSWYEPKPGSGLREDGSQIPELLPSRLHPLLQDGPLKPPDGVAVDEARLFWSWGSLYLLDDGDGSTRWSFWAEAGDGSKQQPDRNAAVTALRAKKIADVQIHETEVLLLQEHQRFFGTELKAETGKLGLRLLRRGGALIGWTVTKKPETRS